ncbi:MAG: recombinase family protein [Chloroflexi bacterium]|nr:recombinase family protein [Chloroflexota bacterium]
MNATESKTVLEQFTVIQRVIIYARVSTEDQAESGTSIDNQVEKSLAYAAAHNMNVVAIFKEDYTGKVLDRPELNKVRDMLRAGLADNVIVYKTNRLDRSEWGLNLLILLQEFKQLGVSLHYSQSGRRVDLSNPVEALMQSIEGWQAGEDHRETVSKLYEGRLKRVKDGYVISHGKAPFGYRVVKHDKHYFFEINETEAATVRLIFEWYILGDETGKALTQGQIADKLNKMGVFSPKGATWKRGGIAQIIANETYAGIWYYGKRNNAAKTYKPKNETIPVSVPAIVSREIWEAAQERLEQNKVNSKRNRKAGRYLLATRVTCGVCHYKMVGVTTQDRGKMYTYYACNNRKLIAREKYCECDSPYFKGDVVDTKVWDELEEASRDKDKLIEGLRGYQSQQESKVEPIKRELAYVEQLLKEKNAEWESAYLDQKVLTSERAKARKAVEIDEIEQVIKELEKRQRDLLAELEEKSLTDEQIIGTVAFAAQVAEDMATLREAEAKGIDNPELKAAVYEEKRKLLAILDVQVTLFVEDGERKAKITAIYYAGEKVLTVEAGTINSTCFPKR